MNFSRNLISCLFFIQLLAVFSFCHAQSHQFRIYSTEDGLAQSQVLDIYQDHKSYLWLATYGGISRYDGRSFKNYTMNEGLESNQVRTIYEDKKGNMWFGTYGGGVAMLLPDSLQYDAARFKIYTEEDGLSSNYIFDITEDRNGNLWFATNGGGAAVFDGEAFDTINTADGLASNRVYSIIEDSKGAIWLATWEGVCRFDEATAEKLTCYTENDGLVNNRTVSLFEDGNNNLWAGSYGGGVSIYNLGHVNNDHVGRFVSLEANADLLNKKVTTITEDLDGNIWLGTYGGGVHKYDGMAFTYYSENEGLNNNLIWKVFCDNEGNKWFGTNGGGAVKYTGDRFTYYNEENGLINNAVLSISESADGHIWFGTTSGLSKYNKKLNSFTNLNEQNKIGNNIWSITQDDKGNTWIGTSDGIRKYSGERFIRYGIEDGLSNVVVNKVFIDSKKSIWFCTNAGLTLLDNGTLINFTQNSGLHTTQIFSMIEDRRGNFWLGTNHGVVHFNPDSMTVDSSNYILLTDSSGLSMNVVYTLVEDKKGNIWMGTYGMGISILHNPEEIISPYDPTCEWSRVSVEDGLSNGSVVSMEFDGNGDLLIGVNNGLNKLDISEYFETGNIIIRQYGKWEGFTGMECNQNAMYRDDEGNVWIGTVNGAIKYNLLHDNLKTTKPPVTHITGLLISHEPALFPPNAQFAYNSNHLTFEFIGISFRLPEKVMYQYRLDGLEKEWSPPGRENFATYPGLSPGSYTFMVQAANHNNVWNEHPETYSFKVLAPFWQTWWFIVLSSLLISGVIFFLIRTRIKKLEKAKNKLEAIIEDREKAESKLKETNTELETFLYKASHDLKGPLSSMYGLINIANEETKDPLVKKYLDLIGTSVNKLDNILEELMQITIIKQGKIQKEPVKINSVIKDTLQTFESYEGFDEINIKIDNRLKSPINSDSGLLKTILRNLIENAIKYRRDDANNPFVNISVNKNLENMIVEIADNGKGIPKKYQQQIFDMFFRATESSKGSGLGLYIVKNAVEKLGGTIKIKSQPKIGTTFTVSLPN